MLDHVLRRHCSEIRFLFPTKFVKHFVQKSMFLNIDHFYVILISYFNSSYPENFATFSRKFQNLCSVVLHR